MLGLPRVLAGTAIRCLTRRLTTAACSFSRSSSASRTGSTTRTPTKCVSQSRVRGAPRHNNFITHLYFCTFCQAFLIRFEDDQNSEELLLDGWCVAIDHNLSACIWPHCWVCLGDDSCIKLSLDALVMINVLSYLKIAIVPSCATVHVHVHNTIVHICTRAPTGIYNHVHVYGRRSQEDESYLVSAK